MQILQKIENKIYEIRGQKVMLDYDLAELYGTETKRLKEAVRRNLKRYPPDFMFELTKEEFSSLKQHINNVKIVDSIKTDKALRTQNATLDTNARGKHSKYPPFAFTEHGVTMLASILNSDRAIQMNIAIVRAFISIRNFLTSTPNINDKLNELRNELKTRIDEHDTQLNAIYDSLESLLDKKQDEQEQKEKWENRKRIGFKAGK
jgi:phage regulator Rha-like protein